MSATPEPTGLQFDRADFHTSEAAAAAATCKGCARPIADTYFEVNGLTTCASCHAIVTREQAATAGTTGVVRAIGAGLGAGVAGALLYWAVLAATGYALGLISVVVGYLVGRAVRWGSGGRGGRVYQVIAVLITYLAIDASYVSIVVGQWADISGASDLVVVVGFLLAMPVFMAFHSLLSGIIVGFALWEAWKITRRVRFRIAGPFTLSPSAPAPPPQPAPASGV
jgi:hypothetical protein